jgi:Spy/CpxP family protein refolding chaperone
MGRPESGRPIFIPHSPNTFNFFDAYQLKNPPVLECCRRTKPTESATTGDDMKKALLSAALVLVTATALPAQQGKNRSELSAPIVRLTPLIKQNADALGLTAEQRADLQNWLATSPPKRKALEAEAIAARAALRTAILDGAPAEERASLAAKVGEYEVKLVTMRSNCADHWRTVLTPEQFAQLVAMAKKQ